MLRFLKSIGLEVESADSLSDLDFELVGRDTYNPHLIHMAIRKENPWDFSSLERFMEGLATIPYPYDLRFSYENPSQLDDLDALFHDWYFATYHIPSSLVLQEGEEDVIELCPTDDAAKSSLSTVLEAFNSFLNFLSYPYQLVAGEEKKETKAPEPEKVEEPVSAPEETSEPDEPEPSEDSEETAEPSEEAEENECEPDTSDESSMTLESNSAVSDEEAEAYAKELREAEESYLHNLQDERNARTQRLIYEKGDYVKLNDLNEVYTTHENHVDVEGELYGIDDKDNPPRKNRRGKFMLVCGIGDARQKNAVKIRLLESSNGLKGDMIAGLNEKANGRRVRVRGVIESDIHTGQKQIFVHYLDDAPAIPLRDDPEPNKRVELHLHTKMSAMDGVGDAQRYIDLAIHMGMKAMAITDHGVIQSFPIAETYLSGLKKKKPDLDFKILYGVEFYAFHKPQMIYNAPKEPMDLRKANYCVLDFETTGLSQTYDRPTEFGAVFVEHGMVRNNFDTFINAGVKIPEAIQKKTHITNEMIASAPNEKEALEKIMAFIGDENTILVAHNATFDIGFLNMMRKRQGLPPIKNPYIDTLALSHWLRPDSRRHNLGALSKDLQLDTYDDEKAHRADFDAGALNSVWQVLINVIAKKVGKTNPTTEDLEHPAFTDTGMYRSLKCSHLIAIAKDQAGLKDLYKLISKSETAYMAVGSTPRIDYDDVQNMREHLILGSACQNGEVFVSAIEKRPEDLEKAISFVDYVEIQPREQYRFYIETGEYTEEKLDLALHAILDTAEKLHKPVCATGDCHYVNPVDKVTRDIYVFQKAIGGGFHPLMTASRRALEEAGHHVENPDQHFYSTKEMLDSFRKWLPEEKCQEIVIQNTNWVADQISGDIKILKDHLYTPDANLPGSAEHLKEICYHNLEEQYGPNPDPEVKARLDRELEGIIGHGYSVTYYIAHLLIKWANSHGFFVGSRGSVGSSFAAHMAGITEVDALNPHYLCPKCKHFEWADPRKYRSGFDLPHKKCPECGTDMLRNGQSIPFETFLGFKADKVPDIDLNFPQDHLDEAHDETRRMLSTPEENKLYAEGKPVVSPHVIRAGTITTVEYKIACGYVKGYYERALHEPVTNENNAYISYLAERCVGVKRSTGQHPGGIVVIPADMDIFDFAPYQYPSDDPSKGWLTTHYEFASMHDSVLKLDELGHVDPMALRMMHEATGVDFRTIPMDDKEVMGLFLGVGPLHMKSNPLGFKTGAVGLPEFGTPFVQGLLEEAKPKTFNDLLIISGLSHGTNVWNDNAQLLISQGKVLDQVIGCRDDIMNYLILQGLDHSEAFHIMEDVRKARGLKPEYEKDMRDHGVPDWYIQSCHKIKYLFPRAHATAYVMAGWRVAWYKVHKPLAFYSVYFSTRCNKFDIKKMTLPEDKLLDVIHEMQQAQANKTLSDTDAEVLKGLTVAIECVDRGYTIENVDLRKSDAKFWTIDAENNAIVPPFSVIPNFGTAAAEGIVAARSHGGPFLSKEDLIERVRQEPLPNDPTHFYSLGTSAMAALDDVGATKGLDDTNQMSLFDFSF